MKTPSSKLAFLIENTRKPVENEPPVNSVGPCNAEHILVLTSGGRGAFSVAYLGEVIVPSSQTPEQDAALVLCKLGLGGHLSQWIEHTVPTIRHPDDGRDRDKAAR